MLLPLKKLGYCYPRTIRKLGYAYDSIYRPTSINANRRPIIRSTVTEELYTKTESLHPTPTAEMNLSDFIDEVNATFELFDVNETEQQQRRRQRNRSAVDFAAVETFYDAVQYVWLAIGIPGNILSAIVWLRLHVASKNSSAVYLAALAINDLVFLLDKIIYNIERHVGWPRWFRECEYYVYLFTTILETLLVLGFSAERLIAVCCPLQVGSLRCIYA